MVACGGGGWWDASERWSGQRLIGQQVSTVAATALSVLSLLLQLATSTLTLSPMHTLTTSLFCCPFQHGRCRQRLCVRSYTAEYHHMGVGATHAAAPPPAGIPRSARVELLAHDHLSHVASFQSINDLLICTSLSTALHRFYDADRVWRPRLPPPRPPPGPLPCKALYLRMCTCSDHALRGCFHLVPVSPPLPCAPLLPEQLERLIGLDRHLPIPAPPLPPIQPLPLCRQCLLPIVGCIAATVWGSISCVVRLSETEFDVRGGDWEDRCFYHSLILILQPPPVPPPPASTCLPCFPPRTSPSPPTTASYQVTSSQAGPWGTVGLYAVNAESNVAWRSPAPRTEGRWVQCDAHLAKGCAGQLHHYAKAPYRWRRCVCHVCRATCEGAVFHCSLCWFDICRSCGTERKGRRREDVDDQVQREEAELMEALAERDGG